jgi:hypothetical protein
VIELTEASSGYSAFWGLYSCTVLLSGLFVLRECLELVALGPRTYFSSGTGNSPAIQENTRLNTALL